MTKEGELNERISKLYNRRVDNCIFNLFRLIESLARPETDGSCLETQMEIGLLLLLSLTCLISQTLSNFVSRNTL